MAARAKIRLNNDKGDKTDWQRFKKHSGCNLCKDYMHRTQDHKCSICGKKGSEMSCCQPKCTICGEWGHEKATHQCTLCGDLGHEGECQTPDFSTNKPDSTIEEGTEGISGGEAIASLAVNSTTSGDPVKVEFEGSIFKVIVNREHQLFRDFIDAVKSLDPDDRIETKED